MKTYLYLTEEEWVNPWVNGGVIPVSLASKYLSNERYQTSTPDENLIHESPVDLTRRPEISFSNGGGAKGITLLGNVYNGASLPDVAGANYYHEDGLILSFSNTLSSHIANELGKSACVEIVDIHKLKSHIDTQLGCVGVMQKCKYTDDHQRNHFLKSEKDEWQDEFRMFWPIQQAAEVVLPPGIGNKVAKMMCEGG